MVEQQTRAEDTLTELIQAASDPTRPGSLTLLAQSGPTRVTEIAARFDISLKAVSKHIKLLEQAGLVGSRTMWREHLIQMQMTPLALVDQRFASLR